MIYEGLVYFAGPQTLWGRKVAEHEVIFRVRAPWLWVVRMQTLNAWRQLNHERCGYVIKRGDGVIDCTRAGIEYTSAPEPELSVEQLRNIISERQH